MSLRDYGDSALNRSVGGSTRARRAADLVRSLGWYPNALSP
jgi:hypothetical protein